MVNTRGVQRNVKIRVLSDLHLEFKDWKPPKADVVVFAGDIHVGVNHNLKMLIYLTKVR